MAQTHLELSLAKGELVVITRKVDDNWFEGKIGGRKGKQPNTIIKMMMIDSFHSAWEHRAAATISLHLTPFRVRALISLKVIPSLATSISLVFYLVILSHTHFLLPCGFHSKVFLALFRPSRLKVRLLHFHVCAVIISCAQFVFIENCDQMFTKNGCKPGISRGLRPKASLHDSPI